MLGPVHIASKVRLSCPQQLVDTAAKALGHSQVGKDLYAPVPRDRKLANVECGYSCHAKCQMKAPQDCTGVNVKLEAKKSKKKKKVKDSEEEDEDSVNGSDSLRRTNSMSSSITPSVNTMASIGSPTPASPPAASAPRATTSRHIAAAPPPTKYISTPIAPASNIGGGGAQKAKVLFKYEATSPEELSVKPSDILTVIEPDDGSGWILAKVGGNEGLVPASYVEMRTSEVPKKGPPVAPRRGAKKTEESKKTYLRAMYDYDASSKLELSIHEGDMLVLVGEDKGDGWTEVEMKGKVGSVPSNYVEVVDKS